MMMCVQLLDIASMVLSVQHVFPRTSLWTDSECALFVTLRKHLLITCTSAEELTWVSTLNQVQHTLRHAFPVCSNLPTYMLCWEQANLHVMADLMRRLFYCGDEPMGESALQRGRYAALQLVSQVWSGSLAVLQQLSVTGEYEALLCHASLAGTVLVRRPSTADA